MKNICVLFLIVFPICAFGQVKGNKLNLDKLPVDMSKGWLADTFHIDINNDQQKDLIFSYYYNSPNDVEKYGILSLIYEYVPSGKYYKFRYSNNKLIAFKQYKLKSVVGYSFVIENFGSKDDNAYNMYFSFDPNNNDLKLSKYEIINEESRSFIDPKTGKVKELPTERKVTLSKNVNEFQSVSKVDFWELFVWYINEDFIITSEKAIIYNSPGVKTSKYLINGDIVYFLEENGEWVKIKYAGENVDNDEESSGNKKVITIGWVKKADLKNK